MPTYQYECAKCGHQFEVFQSMKDNALEVCPKDKCSQKRWGKGKVQRQLGVGAGLIFKGSGFYITDYRSDSYKAAAKKDSEGGSSSAKKPDTSSSSPSSSSGSSSTSSTPKSESKPKPSAT
ncbi:MAG: zinc ribbon domain-containing protein [Verrucomicrobiales bacterium]|nr:zinc ribbon domain-containing protein [Verrucomicrobiales bacterium]